MILRLEQLYTKQSLTKMLALARTQIISNFAAIP